MVYNGGKTIANLTFTNLYIAGDTAWDPADRTAIDSALSAAMSDQNLNNVVAQYFPGQTVLTTFVPSTNISIPAPSVFCREMLRRWCKTCTIKGLCPSST